MKQHITALLQGWDCFYRTVT